MAPDPNLFLSTIVLASGALVAIIGGLLVARFVGLDTDQQTNRRVLIAAAGRLASARRRAEEAHYNLQSWEARGFLDDPKVLHAIGEGVSDPAILRKLGNCPLTAEELRPFVDEVADEFSRARQHLADYVPEPRERWAQFRRRASDLPQIRWSSVWNQVFGETIDKRAKEIEQKRAAQEAARRRSNPFGFDTSAFHVPMVTPASDHGAIRARRYDELRAADDRAQQRVEDYEDELRRLRDEHADIIRPDKRLWVGVAILAVFAGIGVAWPLYIMSIGPTDLASVWWLVWPFCGVLAALVGYVVVYLFNLSRRRLPPVDATVSLDQTGTGN